jgi:hypothetical protein
MPMNPVRRRPFFRPGLSLLLLPVFFVLAWTEAARAEEIIHLVEPTDPLVLALQKVLPPQTQASLRRFDFLRCDHDGEVARLAFWASRQGYKDTLALYRFRRDGGGWYLAASAVRTLHQPPPDKDEKLEYALPEDFRLPGEPFHPLEGPEQDITALHDLIQEDAEYNREPYDKKAYERFRQALEESRRIRLEANALSLLAQAADDYFKEVAAAFEDLSSIEWELARAESALGRGAEALERREELLSRIDALTAEVAEMEADYETRNKRKPVGPDPSELPLMQRRSELESLRQELSKLPQVDRDAVRKQWLRVEAVRLNLEWARMRRAEYRKLVALPRLLQPRTLAQSMEMRGHFFQARTAFEGELENARRLVDVSGDKAMIPPRLASIAELHWDEEVEEYFAGHQARFERHVEWLRLQINRFDYEMHRLLREVEEPPSGFGRVAGRP